MFQSVEDEIGEVAKSVMPVFKHLLIDRGEETNTRGF